MKRRAGRDESSFDVARKEGGDRPTPAGVLRALGDAELSRDLDDARAAVAAAAALGDDDRRILLAGEGDHLFRSVFLLAYRGDLEAVAIDTLGAVQLDLE